MHFSIFPLEVFSFYQHLSQDNSKLFIDLKYRMYINFTEMYVTYG